MNTCRTCQAPIVWARTEANNRLIPLDADPHPAGNVELLPGSIARVHSAGQQTLLDGPAGVRYMPHHATCPNWAGAK